MLIRVNTDGQEALDRVKESMQSQHPYNLIFMDVQMPNLNGLESTRLIRETGYSAPIVALSAYSEDSNIKECLESGMNDFISKPIRRPRLKQVLKTFCSPIPEEEAEDKEAGQCPGRDGDTEKVVSAGSASSEDTKVEPEHPSAENRSSTDDPGGIGRSSYERPVSPPSPTS